MTAVCKSAAKRRSLILPVGQELICSRTLNRCAPPFTQTHVHTHHTAMGPDLHPSGLGSAGEGADGVAGLGPEPTPRGPSFAPLMLKTRSRMNHHRESSWGEERKGKRIEEEEKGEEGMGNDRAPRGYRGQRLDAEY